MSEPVQVQFTDAEASAYSVWAEAHEAEARWKAIKEEAAARLFELTGVKPDTAEAKVVEVTDADGYPLFKSEVFPRTSVSSKLVRERHPEVAAECEVTSYVKTIKEWRSDT